MTNQAATVVNQETTPVERANPVKTKILVLAAVPKEKYARLYRLEIDVNSLPDVLAREVEEPCHMAYAGGYPGGLFDLGSNYIFGEPCEKGGPVILDDSGEFDTPDLLALIERWVTWREAMDSAPENDVAVTSFDQATEQPVEPITNKMLFDSIKQECETLISRIRTNLEMGSETMFEHMLESDLLVTIDKNLSIQIDQDEFVQRDNGLCLLLPVKLLKINWPLLPRNPMESQDADRDYRRHAEIVLSNFLEDSRVQEASMAIFNRNQEIAKQTISRYRECVAMASAPNMSLAAEVLPHDLLMLSYPKTIDSLGGMSIQRGIFGSIEVTSWMGLPEPGQPASA